ncbi:MAG: 3'-5' exonuclease [Xenococcaceae cyanobacterium MO_234.B1]|nr:3'-5' exonuclease [Xenococcaceae cyanobacterium MO_234.B1]
MQTDTINIERYKYFLIIDLEATCSDTKQISRRKMEIIEIGAVMVEAENLNIVSEFQTFIKPVRNPILTDFCTKLTEETIEKLVKLRGASHFGKSIEQTNENTGVSKHN